jgi:hypothetical protein
MPSRANKKRTTSPEPRPRKQKTSPMPGLVFNEVTFDDGEKFSEPKKPRRNSSKKTLPNNSITMFQHYPPDYAKRRTLMWVGVVSFMVVIIFFQLWSVALNFSFFNWNNSSEKMLFEKSKLNWNQTLAAENHSSESELEQRSSEQQIKDIISQILTTSTTTATPQTIPTNDLNKP